MNFLTALLLCFLLQHRALFSEGSFLSEKILINEDISDIKLFATIKEWIEKMPDVQELMIVGSSNDQLRKTKLLLETFVSFVSGDATKICTAQRLDKGTIIIYFLSSLEQEYIRKVTTDLATCQRNRLCIIFQGFEASVSDIDFVLRNIRDKTSQKPIFLHHNRQSIKLYDSDFATDCSWRSRFVLEWMPGDDANQKLPEFFRQLDVSGCTFATGVMHRPPWMHLANDKSGVARITGGFESQLISTIAKKMKITLRPQKFEYSGDDSSNKSMHVMISKCANRKMEICIGHIRPQNVFTDLVDISVTYEQEYVSWYVPDITHKKNNVVTSEFSWSSWLLIGLIFLASFLIDRIVRRSHPLNRGKADRSGNCLIILNFIGSTLGSPIIYNPVSIGGKLLLISYLLYSTVITTAYKTSLSSIITVDNSESLINDDRGIITANLTTGGNVNALGFLEDQRNEYEIIPKLIRRFKLEPNTTKALLRVSNDKDFAYLTSTTNFNYHKSLLAKAGYPISVHGLKKYVLNYGLTMVFPKSSVLKRQINMIIQHLGDAGILKHWMSQYYETVRFSEKNDTSERLHGFTRNKFYFIFFIYCLSLIFCIFTFIGEVIVHKFQLAETVGRLKTSLRVKVRRCIPF